MSSLGPLVTVVMPVYNQRLEYLEEAVESVFAQTATDWLLLLADNHSNDEVWERLGKYADRDTRVSLLRQTRNLGVFANLNSALPKVSTPYVLFLCSDDRLKASAIERLLEIALEYPTVDLILPSYHVIAPRMRSHSVDAQVSFRRAVCSTTRPLERKRALELLLRFGSINGNLTGMFARRDLFDRAGPFRDDWSQASDWEWIHRAVKSGTMLLSLDIVSEIRSHDGQLSSSNLRTATYTREVAAMVRTLLSDPELKDHPRARTWALAVMENQAWQAGRAALRGDLRLAADIVGEVGRTTGVASTFATLVAALPGRIGARLRGVPRLPPP